MVSWDRLPVAVRNHAAIVFGVLAHRPDMWLTRTEIRRATQLDGYLTYAEVGPINAALRFLEANNLIVSRPRQGKHGPTKRVEYRAHPDRITRNPGESVRSRRPTKRRGLVALYGRTPATVAPRTEGIPVAEPPAPEG